jgi:hypothetical protein
MAKLEDLDLPNQPEFHLSPILAALEGDVVPLTERLGDIAAKLSVADAAVVRVAADMLADRLAGKAIRPAIDIDADKAARHRALCP